MARPRRAPLRDLPWGVVLVGVMALALGCWAVGCWADFPEDRLADGSTRPPPGDDAPRPAGERDDCPDADGDGRTACEGDCNDQDRRVFPGQEGFFDEPAASTGSFDYDCDGQEERKIPQGFDGCELAGDRCEGGGWQGDVPACGEQGDLVSCERRGDRCREQRKETRQSCR